MTRIAVFSDIHGNLTAFWRFLKSAEIDSVDSFICLGDLIGYIPHPSALDAVLNSLPSDTVYLLGNHEHMVLNQDWRDDDSILLHRKCYQLLMDSQLLDTVKQWPQSHLINGKFGSALFVHGTPANPTFGRLTEESAPSISPSEHTFVFAGNTHRPFSLILSSTVFTNVGSVGLPRDIGCIGSYALFDLDEGIVNLRRFDIGMSIQDECTSHGGHNVVSELSFRDSTHNWSKS